MENVTRTVVPLRDFSLRKILEHVFPAIKIVLNAMVFPNSNVLHALIRNIYCLMEVVPIDALRHIQFQLIRIIKFHVFSVKMSVALVV
jgi:hypothetical protein